MYPNPGTDGLTVMIENGYVGNVLGQLQSALGDESVSDLISLCIKELEHSRYLSTRAGSNLDDILW